MATTVHARGLDARQLEVIEAIAREGSVTRAAAQIRVTQSAVSHVLAGVEQSLGRSLFVRGRRMELTPDGERVVEAARRIFAELDALGADLSRAPRRAPLRVATECYTTYQWLPTALRALRDRGHDVDVQIALEATRRPIEALLKGDLDVAITSSPPRDRALVETRLFEDDLVVVCAPSHPFASRPTVRARDFDGQVLLTYDVDRDELDLFRRVLLPARVTLAAVHRVPLTEAILELVKAGFGVAVLARWIVAPRTTSGELLARPLSPTPLTRSWRAVRRRRTENEAAIGELSRIARRRARSPNPASASREAPTGQRSSDLDCPSRRVAFCARDSPKSRFMRAPRH